MTGQIDDALTKLQLFNQRGFMSRMSLVKTYQVARRVVIAVVGTSIVLIGVALIVLPGPAFLLIPLGLAILGIEFAWARHWLRIVKRRVQGLKNSAEDIKRKAGNLFD